MGRTPPPTKTQKARWDRIRELGCLACGMDGAYQPCEIHHLTDRGVRLGHDATIGLCEWHHRGSTGLTQEAATKLLGPSLAHGSRPFKECYGSDEKLLKMQNQLLKEAYGD